MNPPLPLVSIICRSINRPQLRQALESIASQEYSSIEVILVDALGEGTSVDSELHQQLTLIEVGTGTRCERSAAANLGLDNAKGEFILFLDDDDFIASEHISSLVELLSKKQNTRVAYSSVRKVNTSGEELEEVFAHGYDPILLRRDNYIPIHAVLFSRLFLEDGCRFDESLTIFEDWDFWLQLSQFGDFAHLDKVTAFYREGGDSETAQFNSADADKNHPIKKARAAVLNKWVKRWTGEQIDEALSQAERVNYQREKRISSLHNELLQTKNYGVNLEELLLEQTAQTELLKNSLSNKSNEVLKVRENIKELDNRLVSSYKHAENLNRHVESLQLTVDLIYSSRLWRLMGPVRRLLRIVRRQLNPTLVPRPKDHLDQESDRKGNVVEERNSLSVNGALNSNVNSKSVSYTHLTLPTNREV